MDCIGKPRLSVCPVASFFVAVPNKRFVKADCILLQRTVRAECLSLQPRHFSERKVIVYNEAIRPSGVPCSQPVPGRCRMSTAPRDGGRTCCTPWETSSGGHAALWNRSRTSLLATPECLSSLSSTEPAVRLSRLHACSVSNCVFFLTTVMHHLNRHSHLGKS